MCTTYSVLNHSPLTSCTCMHGLSTEVLYIVCGLKWPHTSISVLRPCMYWLIQCTINNRHIVHTSCIHSILTKDNLHQEKKLNYDRKYNNTLLIAFWKGATKIIIREERRTITTIDEKLSKVLKCYGIIDWIVWSNHQKFSFLKLKPYFWHLLLIAAPRATGPQKNTVTFPLFWSCILEKA